MKSEWNQRSRRMLLAIPQLPPDTQPRCATMSTVYAPSADVIAPNGKRFRESSIGIALATRDLMDHLRSTGQATSGPKAFGPLWAKAQYQRPRP
jgi:hypothetical protein